MRILIIEDEHTIANAIKKGLEQESYAVDVTYDGQSGLDMAIGEEYDLIILDRMLPIIDGIELCKKIRQSENHTPILMLTAKGQTSDKVAGLNSGVDDYMVKPFAFEELLARIKALLRRPPQTRNIIYTIDNLTLNTVSYEVKRGNSVLHLSSKEFALLEYLMRNDNTILSKDQIISHVWNYDSDVLPNTVEAYIGYLRNKIDRPFKRPLIHTVRGFGYKISIKS